MEDQPIQEAPPTEIAETPVQEEAKEETAEPTKSVKNFWERLDEVFTQNSQLRERMDELIEQFPDTAKINQDFKSSLFQPERISLCSNDDIQPSSQIPGVEEVETPYSSTTGHYPAEYFSNFRIRLQRPLRNVKSIQMLSGVIPNATTNIPDTQTFFWWYKLRNVADSIIGAWTAGESYYPGDIVSFFGNYFVAIRPNENTQPVGVQLNYWWKGPIQLPVDQTRPNYYDLNIYHLKYVYLAPTWFWTFDKVLDIITNNPEPNFFNRTYQDYDDIVSALNFCLGIALGNNNSAQDISFQYNATLNKIIMVPNPTNIADGYYYLPCGYEDPNIPLFMSYVSQQGDPAFAPIINFAGTGFTYSPNLFSFDPQSTLNTRLGFTWNGRFPDPFLSSNPWSNDQLLNSLYWYLRQTDPYYAVNQRFKQNIVTFNNYPDLVNTSCVRIYADFALGSTQDSLGSSLPAGNATQQGLLSIVPINTTNLGVGFYQNNFNNPLTKIPPNLTEIGITMLTDQGTPFYLPNSATVLLELAIEYH